MKLVLIDADSMVWIIAYHAKELNAAELMDVANVQMSCDSLFSYIVQTTEATHYLASFSSSKCFRHDLYKFAPYKGNRPPKPEFMKMWERIIKEYFVSKYGFLVPDNIEADDIISLYQENYPEAIVASPDKDLRQNPGYFFDYKKTDNSVIDTVTPAQAMNNLYVSAVTGDDADNIKGIYGLGEVKAKKLFEECTNFMEYESVLSATYQKYYGAYYGPMIQQETFWTLRLLRRDHLLGTLGAELYVTESNIREVPIELEQSDAFSQEIKNLGW